MMIENVKNVSTQNNTTNSFTAMKRNETKIETNIFQFHHLSNKNAYIFDALGMPTKHLIILQKCRLNSNFFENSCHIDHKYQFQQTCKYAINKTKNFEQKMSFEENLIGI